MDTGGEGEVLAVVSALVCAAVSFVLVAAVTWEEETVLSILA